MIEELANNLRVIALPMRTNFRGLSLRETALFEGPYGWGEFAAFKEYGAEESVPWLNSALEAAFSPRPSLFRNKVKVNATIPATNDRAMIEDLLDRYQGCEVAKIKIGGDIAKDLERVKIVRSIKPDIRLRFDVNGAWSVEQAIADSYALYENFGGIEYIEQPCATLEELREFKSQEKINVTVCGDEVVRKSKIQGDLDGAVDLIMLKVSPIGGINKAHEIAEFHKKPVVVSSALESAVGISYGAALAASFEETPYAAGLATGELFTGDVGYNHIVNGEIEVKSITPSFEYEVSGDTRAWWQNRLNEVWIAGSEKFAREEGWDK